MVKEKQFRRTKIMVIYKRYLEWISLEDTTPYIHTRWRYADMCRHSSLNCTAKKSRNMYKAGGAVGLSSVLGAMSTSVLAASDNEKPSNDISVDELSLYTTPEQKFSYVEPEKGQVEEGVATLRKMAEPYTTWYQGAYGAVKPKVDSALQFGQDSYAYLKNPPSEFYPRAGIIGFAGILGLFLARGSRLKKLAYPAGLMTVGAAMYYPQEAATIAKKTGDSVYDWALQAYVATENLIKNKPGPKTRAEKIEQTEEKPSSAETKA